MVNRQSTDVNRQTSTVMRQTDWERTLCRASAFLRMTNDGLVRSHGAAVGVIRPRMSTNHRRPIAPTAAAAPNATVARCASNR